MYRDVALLIRSHADVHTYCKLLYTSRIFWCSNDQAENPDELGIKLLRRLEELPKGDKPVGTRSAFVFFSKERRPQLKEELDGSSSSEVTRQLGDEWRRLSYTQRKRYEEMSNMDRSRRLSQSNPETWKTIVSERSWLERRLVALGGQWAKQGGKRTRLRLQDARSKYMWKLYRECRQNASTWSWGGLEKEAKEAIFVPKQRSAWIFFCKDRRPTMKEEHPKFEGERSERYFPRITRLLGREWRSLTEEQRAPYEQAAIDEAAKNAKELLNTPDVSLAPPPKKKRRRAPSAYANFVKSQNKRIRFENAQRPDEHRHQYFGRISRLTSAIWNALTPEEKRKYSTHRRYIDDE